MYAIITENDESPWKDKKGQEYHFPKTYKKYLTQGTNVIYYKGTMKKKQYDTTRMSPSPHYFGIASIGNVYPDPESKKGDLFAVIENFMEFSEAVLAKQNDEYLEHIPENKKVNYWRNGVRPIDYETYKKILLQSDFSVLEIASQSSKNDELVSYEEGAPSKKYVTVYERNPKLRMAAIDHHGTNCRACGFSFERTYGEIGKGYIHIHHIVPISNNSKTVKVNPQTDLVPLCANCHAMVHRNRNKTLSVEALKKIIMANL